MGRGDPQRSRPQDPGGHARRAHHAATEPLQHPGVGAHARGALLPAMNGSAAGVVRDRSAAGPSFVVAGVPPMTVVVALEQRFARTPDGVVWAPGPFRTTLWPRYLEVFDAVRVLARVADMPVVPADWEPAAGPGVS